MLDFPSSPAANQEFDVFVWSGMAWDRKDAVSSASPGHPAITSLVPSTMVADGATQTLRVMGENFVTETELFENGVVVTKTFIDQYELQTSVVTPTADGADVFDTKNVALSNAMTLTYTAPPTAPVIASIDPTSAWNNWVTLDITVNGSSFLPSTKATWNGAVRADTVYLSANQLRFNINPSTEPLGANFVNVITDTIAGTGPDQMFSISY